MSGCFPSIANQVISNVHSLGHGGNSEARIVLKSISFSSSTYSSESLFDLTKRRGSDVMWPYSGWKTVSRVQGGTLPEGC